MKLNRGIILFSFLILTTILNISKVVSTRVKRQESMMEYLHKFLKNDNSKLATTQIKKEEPNNFSFKERGREISRLKKKAFSKTSESEGENEGNTNESNLKFERLKIKLLKNFKSEVPGLNPNTTQRENNPNPILGEWFMISSKLFKDKSRFPPIVTEETTITIKTDVNNFRINGAYGHKSLKNNLPSDKFFYFRLSGLNLFYSSTETDINILGSINVESIVEVKLKSKLDASTEFITTCFTVIDIEKIKWKICGLNESVVKNWFCQLKSFLNIQDLENCPNNNIVDPKLPPPKVVEKTVEITQPIILVPLEQRFCNDNWNYQKFSSDWECDCKEGSEQSPIDLPVVESAIESEVKPQFEYSRIKNNGLSNGNGTPDGSTDEEGKLKIILKENLLRIFADKFGRIVTMDGSIFHANEINFHMPSEHKIDGMQYDLEVTILHSGVSKGDIAKQASLSFLFERTPGTYNSFIENLNYFDLPNTFQTEKDIKSISIFDILKTSEEEEVSSMNPFSFYTYQGSLTTPPCTEDTIVYVASKPLKIGSSALQLLQEAMRIPDLMDSKGNIIRAEKKEHTNRPVQPLNGRPVFWFDHTKTCGPKPKKEDKEVNGHYEKIRKSYTSYFYVNGDKPSGLSNAWVVSEGEATGKGAGPNPKK
jgi:carbonic anhydrase